MGIHNLATIAAVAGTGIQWKRRALEAESALAAMTEAHDRALECGARASLTLSGMTAERAHWKRRAELARATVHSLAAKLEAVEALRDKWAVAYTNSHLFLSEPTYDKLRGKEECADELTDALATTGPSLRQRVEAVLAQWVDKEKMLSAVMDGWLRVNPHLTCQSMRADLERALKREG